jgi:hypothetical protein
MDRPKRLRVADVLACQTTTELNAVFAQWRAMLDAADRAAASGLTGKPLNTMYFDAARVGTAYRQRVREIAEGKPPRKRGPLPPE